MKYLQRYLSLLFALVMCVGLFSITAHAEEIENLSINIKYKIWCDSNDSIYAEKAYDVNNNSTFSHTVTSSNTNLNYAVTTSNTFTIGTDDGSIIAKQGEKLNFRIDNIVTRYNIGYVDGAYTSHSWTDHSKVGRTLSLIHTDGSWTTYAEGYGITWNYTSGNDSHNISLNIDVPKDVRKIQYVEYVNVYELTNYFGYSQSFILSGASSSPLKVTIDKQSEEAGLLEGIGNKLSSGFSALGDKLSSVVNGVLELPQKLWNLISDGLKSLFVPSEESMTAYKDKWDELLSTRLGAVYQVCDIVTDSWSEIGNADTTDTINFPSVTIPLPDDAQFTFGGYDVKIVPEGFDVLVQAIKLIVGIVCTLSFINGMLKRYDEIMGVEQ